MAETGCDVVTPVPPPDDVREPLLDLSSGYIQRALATLPRQGARTPWRVHQNYRKDVRLLIRGPVDDEGVRFTRSTRSRTEART
jgi:hypothetical protein